MTEQVTLKENEDFVFVPIEEDPDAWGVRFTNGAFIETVIVYGAIGFNEVEDNLSFNFSIKSSPDSELTTENTELQTHAADVLTAIIVDGVENGYVQLKDKDASKS